MAAGAVSTSQVYNLHSVDGGLSGGVSFRNVTMHSDEWVCVRDTEDDQACIVLVNLRAGTDQRHRISADSAIMNPTEKILALKSGHTLQIFNMETRVKVKDLTSADPVAYWKWINTDMIALVTTEAVFHWSMKEGAKPKKIFKRNEQLDEATILNYCCDSNELWMFIIAVSKTNRLLEGKLQLYSAERQQSRQIEGHAACFIEKDGSTKVAVARTDEGLEGKLYVIGMPSANDPTPGGTLVTDIHMQTASDFPVALQASNELGIIFLVSRLGKLSLYEASTVTLLWSKDITADPIFTTIVTPDQSLLCIDTKGLVMKYSINKADMVSHIIEEHGAQDAAFAFAANAGVQGHDDLFQKRFDALLNAGDVPAAIKVAVESPGGLLRTQDTVRRLRDAPVQDGHPALSLYFKTLIEKDKLNDFESVELGRIVLARGGVEYMKKLSDENKLSDSEELGDLLHPTAPDMAMRVYFKAQAHPKVVTALIQRGDFAKVLPYCQRVDYKPEWLMLLMRIINTDPDNATELAIAIHQATAEGEKPAIDPNAFVDLLFQRSKFKEIVQYLDSVTARDTEEDGPLQTRLLEVALVNGSAQVGDSLLGRDKFHHFDLPKIGELCERVGLYQRALECYMLQHTRNSGGCLEDVRRVVVRTESISPEYIVDIFGNLSADASLQCLRTLLEASPQNFKICVQVCARFGDVLGTTRLIELFLDVRSWETLYFYLGGLVNTTDDKEVHFRFIEASTHTGDKRTGWRAAELLRAGDVEANPGPPTHDMVVARLKEVYYTRPAVQAALDEEIGKVPEPALGIKPADWITTAGTYAVDAEVQANYEEAWQHLKQEAPTRLREEGNPVDSAVALQNVSVSLTLETANMSQVKLGEWWVRDLPMLNGEVDMSQRCQGHVADPLADTRSAAYLRWAADQVAACLQPGTITVLVGGPGQGKTAVATTILKHRFCLYAECGNTYRGRAFRPAEMDIQQAQNPGCVLQRWIHAATWCLQKLRETHQNLSPAQWGQWMLNGGGESIAEAFRATAKIPPSQMRDDNLPVIIDEGQVLADQLPVALPELSAQTPVLLLGTQLRLITLLLKLSSYTGDPGKGLRRVYVCCGLEALDVTETEVVLSRVLKWPEGFPAASGAALLQGRPRIACGLPWYLSKPHCHMVPQTLVAEYLSDVADDFTQSWSAALSELPGDWLVQAYASFRRVYEAFLMGKRHLAAAVDPLMMGLLPVVRCTDHRSRRREAVEQCLNKTLGQDFGTLRDNPKLCQHVADHMPLEVNTTWQAFYALAPIWRQVCELSAKLNEGRVERKKGLNFVWREWADKQGKRRSNLPVPEEILCMWGGRDWSAECALGRLKRTPCLWTFQTDTPSWVPPVREWLLKYMNRTLLWEFFPHIHWVMRHPGSATPSHAPLAPWTEDEVRVVLRSLFLGRSMSREVRRSQAHAGTLDKLRDRFNQSHLDGPCTWSVEPILGDVIPRVLKRTKAELAHEIMGDMLIRCATVGAAEFGTAFNRLVGLRLLCCPLSEWLLPIVGSEHFPTAVQGAKAAADGVLYSGEILPYVQKALGDGTTDILLPTTSEAGADVVVVYRLDQKYPAAAWQRPAVADIQKAGYQPKPPSVPSLVSSDSVCVSVSCACYPAGVPKKKQVHHDVKTNLPWGQKRRKTAKQPQSWSDFKVTDGTRELFRALNGVGLFVEVDVMLPQPQGPGPSRPVLWRDDRTLRVYITQDNVSKLFPTHSAAITSCLSTLAAAKVVA